MTDKEATVLIGELETLRFFPAGNARVKAVLATRLKNWCRGDTGATPQQQGRWLIDKILDTWREGLGPAAMRELFLEKWPIPKDAA